MQSYLNEMMAPYQTLLFRIYSKEKGETEFVYFFLAQITILSEPNVDTTNFLRPIPMVQIFADTYFRAILRKQHKNCAKLFSKYWYKSFLAGFIFHIEAIHT